MTPILVESVAASAGPYDVRIGSGLLADVGRWLPERLRVRRGWVITDSVVGPQYAATVQAALSDFGMTTRLLTIPAGEASKTLEVVADLYVVLAEEPADRTVPIFALGGGVVGDVGGFLAATWLRGVPLVQCPTTVEAAVDSSIGGKTGVNLAAGKNLVGAFHPPAAVFTDVSTFATLPDRERRAGLAECVKHALIAAPRRLDWLAVHAPRLLTGDAQTLVELVAWNVRIKADVVATDEREEDTGWKPVPPEQDTGRKPDPWDSSSGWRQLPHDQSSDWNPPTARSDSGWKTVPHFEAATVPPFESATMPQFASSPAPRGIGRAALNLGHTTGHAIEQLSAYALRHGECVGLGLLVALRLCVSRGLVAPELLEKTRQVLEQLELPTRAPAGISADALWQTAQSDKKVRNDALRFVGLDPAGSPTWLEGVTEAEFAAALREISPRDR